MSNTERLQMLLDWKAELIAQRQKIKADNQHSKGNAQVSISNLVEAINYQLYFITGLIKDMTEL